MPPTQTSEYMKSEYETPPWSLHWWVNCCRNGTNASGGHPDQRQVGSCPRLPECGGPVLCRGDVGTDRPCQETGGAKLDPVFWTFEAPQGGTFKIVDKRPADQEFGFTLQRDDGTESFCQIHHGYDS
jgi:hypothetical protein